MTEQLVMHPQEQDGTSRSPDLDDLQPELAKTVRFMERVHAAEVFGTPEQSKEFLDSQNYDEFKRWISLVNGMERDIPRAERGQVSDSHVSSEGFLTGVSVEYRPPHKSHRDELLKLVFEKAQSIENPKVAGLTLGLSINAIHYFEDGNGRTARMVYSLLSKGYDGSPEDQAYYTSLLQNTKGREVVDPNPKNSGIDKKIRWEMFKKIQANTGYAEAFGANPPTYVYGGYASAFAGEYSPEELAVSDEIDDTGRRMLFDAMESGGLEITSLMATFPPERIKDFVRTSPDGTRTFVVADDFLPTLSREEIAAWWNNSEQAIASYVKRLINVADRDDIADIAAHYHS